MKLVKTLSKYPLSNKENLLSLLSILGEVFVDIIEKKKRPILENNNENKVLLSKLKELGVISTTREERGGIRVNPKRN